MKLFKPYKRLILIALIVLSAWYATYQQFLPPTGPISIVVRYLIGYPIIIAYFMIDGQIYYLLNHQRATIDDSSPFTGFVIVLVFVLYILIVHILINVILKIYNKMITSIK